MRETKQKKYTGNNQQKGQKRTQKGHNKAKRRLEKLTIKIDGDEDEAR